MLLEQVNHFRIPGTPSIKSLALKEPLGVGKQPKPFTMFMLKEVLGLRYVSKRCRDVVRVLLKISGGPHQRPVFCSKETGAARQLERCEPRANPDPQYRNDRRQRDAPNCYVVPDLSSVFIPGIPEMSLPELRDKVSNYEENAHKKRRQIQMTPAAGLLLVGVATRLEVVRLEIKPLDSVVDRQS